MAIHAEHGAPSKEKMVGVPGGGPRIIIIDYLNRKVIGWSRQKKCSGKLRMNTYAHAIAVDVKSGVP